MLLTSRIEMAKLTASTDDKPLRRHSMACCACVCVCVCVGMKKLYPWQQQHREDKKTRAHAHTHTHLFACFLAQSLQFFAVGITVKACP